jgi:hypothetical protein
MERRVNRNDSTDYLFIYLFIFISQNRRIFALKNQYLFATQQQFFFSFFLFQFSHYSPKVAISPKREVENIGVLLLHVGESVETY